METLFILNTTTMLSQFTKVLKVKVEEGQSVKQGDTIGQAGRNLYNKDAGVHVHFEIRHDGNQ
ncbi:M23 family metallopeptidase [Anaerobacillus sp. HL2]|nr:M23 family metallopeptidase [Anaerobacillus sp. HL2]